MSGSMSVQRTTPGISEVLDLMLFGRGIKINEIDPDNTTGALNLSGTISNPEQFDADQFSEVAQEEGYLVPVHSIVIAGNRISMQVLDLNAFQHTLESLPLEAGF